MAEKRGGPRHFSKPFIEAGLLLQVLLKHEDRVQDFKAYEHLSSGSTPDPKGLIYCLGLLQDLVKIAPQAELHPPTTEGCHAQTLDKQATAQHQWP